MILFQTYDQCPPNLRPAGIPLDFIWRSFEVDDASADSFGPEYFKATPTEFANIVATLEPRVSAYLNATDYNTSGETLRVMKLVDAAFINLHPSKIDFRRHLKPNVYLQKNTIMLPNGRPQKAVYSLDGEDVAEIVFSFEADAFNFMVRRTETLFYIKNNGQKGDGYIIADEFFDKEKPSHLRAIMEERTQARSQIFAEIKAFLNGFLAAYYLPQGKTYPDILTIAGDFWTTYSASIDAWINVGSPQFKTELVADTNFGFLDLALSPDQDVRAWIIQKLSY